MYGFKWIRSAVSVMLLTRTLASASSFYTMVEMAKANGENVYHYLTYLLKKLSDDRMIDDELELLDLWNETIKAEIERCANESN